MNQIKEFYEQYPFPNDRKVEGHDWIFNSLPHAIKQGSEILDCGCGTGEISCFLSKYGNVIGIDLSAVSIMKAQELMGDLKIKNIYFKTEDLTNLKLKQKFDYIFCIGVLHHISNYDLAITNLQKLMRKDSLMVISVYNKHSWYLHKLFKMKLSKTRYMDVYHCPYENRYSEKEFKEKLEGFGFEVIGQWRKLPAIVRLLTGKGKLMSFCVRLKK